MATAFSRSSNALEIRDGIPGQYSTIECGYGLHKPRRGKSFLTRLCKFVYRTSIGKNGYFRLASPDALDARACVI
jgi:hypothetical protein